MSRFFKGKNDIESESDSDSESDVAPVKGQLAGAGRFPKSAYDDSDSESEDEVRVVRSALDRAVDTIRESVTAVRNAMKVGDWSSVQDRFESVNKALEKSKVVLAPVGTPKCYIAMLVELEDLIQSVNKEAQKKMKPALQHAFNRLRLSVPKHNRTPSYENDVKDCREHPEKFVEEVSDDSESDDSEESEEESDDEPVAKKGAPAKAGAAKAGASSAVVKSKFMQDDDSDSSASFLGVDSSSSESEDDRLPGRARWLKKKVVEKDSDSEEEFKKKVVRPSAAAQSNASGNADTVALTITKVKDKETFVDMKEEALDKKLAELLALRGRKHTDSKDLLQKLEMLSRAAHRFGPRKEIPVIMHLISSMFDSNRSIDDYMDLEQWRACYRCVHRVVSLLEADRSIILALIPAEDAADFVAGAASKSKKSAEDDESPQAKGVLKVVGSLESFMARLEDEYNKSLQQINPHTQDYVIRLSDEALLVQLAESVMNYYRRIGEDRAATIVALLHVEHIYYKHDSVAAAVRRANAFANVWGRYRDLHPACLGKADLSNISRNTSVVHPGSFQGHPTVVVQEQNVAAILEGLCQFIFRCGDERTKTRALLCSVYYHALHDRFYRARDLFLMSHIQDTIDKADTKTQILFNRALVTLGLSAFRLGLFQKAHDCLAMICSGRTKELLAQGSARWHDRDSDQERLERRRQIPYHMHINPELLDACHLVSAMILELPHLCRQNISPTAPAAVSRPFRKYLQSYSRQVFTGPPENIREHVLAATKALLGGELKRATELILNLEVWKMLPADGASKVRDMLEAKFKEEAVKVYIITVGPYYEALSMNHICELFRIDSAHARRLVSKMIYSKEISGAWDRPNGSDNILVMHPHDAASVQPVAVALAEKINLLVDSNERILDPLLNVYAYKEDHHGGGSSSSRGGNKGAGNADGQQDRRRSGHAAGFRSSRPNFIRQNARSGPNGQQRSTQGSRGPRTWNQQRSGQSHGRQGHDGGNKGQGSGASEQRRSGWGNKGQE